VVEEVVDAPTLDEVFLVDGFVLEIDLTVKHHPDHLGTAHPPYDVDDACVPCARDR
jgi:hypothetical protein